MFMPADILDAQRTAGELRLTVTPAALVRNVVLIGQLPAGRLRTALLAAYDGLEPGDHRRFQDLTPKGVSAAHLLGPADLQGLALAERIAFLKGMERLLGPRLGKTEARHCICHMPACVLLPVAAFASLLRDDVKSARKAWGAFAKIRRWCAERLPGIDGHVGLADMSFEAFIAAVAGPRPLLLLDLGEPLESKAKRAAVQMLAAYGIADPGAD
jgi:hypothetical protein